MRPKQQQAKIEQARRLMQDASNILADFYFVEPTPPEVGWILQATDLLRVADIALLHAGAIAERRECRKPS